MLGLALRSRKFQSLPKIRGHFSRYISTTQPLPVPPVHFSPTEIEIIKKHAGLGPTIASYLTQSPDEFEVTKSLGFLPVDLASEDIKFGNLLRALNNENQHVLARKCFERFGSFNKADGSAAREYVLALQGSRKSSKRSLQRIFEIVAHKPPVSTEASPLHVVRQRSWLYRLGPISYIIFGIIIVAIYFTSSSDNNSEESGSGGIFGVMKKTFQPVSSDITFQDVKGNTEAKIECARLVEFLKTPAKFAGVKIPKGILLSGPPGTGKTLLAKALAGEAGVPFIAVSGSEFEEMFVGVGARRVRDLFQTAKSMAPCLIFIDEIDTIGGQRDFQKITGVNGTLNQLLVELDGFNNREGIIIIGATNIPESLDPALVRPGRFDRHVYVDLPTLKDRKEILEYYLAKHKCADSLLHRGVDIVAAQTAGLSGAELDNMVNMAAFSAVKQGLPELTLDLMERALLDSAIGKENKTMLLSEKVRQLTAYHEGGHALVALYSEDAPPIRIATIMPRGGALGLVSYLPTELMKTKSELLANLKMSMGGRAAEELIYGPDGITTGAESDLQNATNIAKHMVTHYGMSDEVGHVYIDNKNQRRQQYKGNQKQVEEEVKQIVEKSYQEAKDLLKDKRVELERLAQALLVHETLTREEIEKVIRGEKIVRE